jgi:single-strand DNA-binding protein
MLSRARNGEANQTKENRNVNTHHNRQPGRGSSCSTSRQGLNHQTSCHREHGEYRDGKWVVHDAPTTHFVEAKFELGENIAASLHKGDGVIVVGRESSWTSGESGTRKYGRTINAEFIGPDLNRAIVQVRKVSKDDDGK